MCSWGKHLMTYLSTSQTEAAAAGLWANQENPPKLSFKALVLVPPTNVAFFGHLVEDGGGSETLAILISLRHGRRRHWSQWWRWLTWQTSHNMIAGGGVAGIWDGMLKVRYTIYNCFNIYVVGYAVLYMIWWGSLRKHDPFQLICVSSHW